MANEVELQEYQLQADAKKHSYELVQKLTYFVITFELVFCGYMLQFAEKLTKLPGAVYLYCGIGLAAVCGLLWRFCYNITYHDMTHRRTSWEFKYANWCQNKLHNAYAFLSIFCLIWALGAGAIYLNSFKQIQNVTSHIALNTSPLMPLPSISKTPLIREEIPRSIEKPDYGSSEWWVVYLTGSLSFITLILALYTAKLWKSTNQVVLDAKDTSQRQLRAYLHVTTAHITPYEEIGEGVVTAYVAFKNTGQTPAYKVKQWIGIYPDKLPNDNFIPLNTALGEGAISVMGPEVVNIMSVPTLGPILSDEYLRMCYGEKTLYVYGEIVYEDAFGHERFTRFKFRTRKDKVQAGTLSPCEDGNDAN